jgi:hypothetical protein
VADFGLYVSRGPPAGVDLRRGEGLPHGAREWWMSCERRMVAESDMGVPLEFSVRSS